eukprot:3302499-Pyramimonas_sp.AAC.1
MCQDLIELVRKLSEVFSIVTEAPTLQMPIPIDIIHILQLQLVGRKPNHVNPYYKACQVDGDGDSVEEVPQRAGEQKPICPTKLGHPTGLSIPQR